MDESKKLLNEQLELLAKESKKQNLLPEELVAISNAMVNIYNVLNSF